MFDSKIVAACIKSASAWRRVADLVDPDEFTPTGRFWWRLVDDWYKRDDKATAVDTEILRSRGERDAGRNAQMALEWLAALPDAPSPENAAHEVLLLKREIAYRKLAAAHEDDRDYDELATLTDEHHKLMHMTLDVSSDEWVTDDDMFRVIDPSNLIRVWPLKLNDHMLPGVPRGTNMILFARPEAGKTMFCANMTAGWLRDEHRVLYLGNEEPMARTRLRIASSVTGLTPQELSENPERTRELLGRTNWNKLSTKQLLPGTPSEIGKLIEQAEPACVIIDQLRNLRSRADRSGTKAQTLDQIAVDVRQVLTRYNVLGLSVGQAHAGEHGKPQVTFNADDFDESRTGVPGQADVMIALGYDEQLDAHNQRLVSVPKNKVSGNREGFVISFDSKRSRMK